jgi:hypothetical protein
MKTRIKVVTNVRVTVYYPQFKENWCSSWRNLYSHSRCYMPIHHKEVHVGWDDNSRVYYCMTLDAAKSLIDEWLARLERDNLEAQKTTTYIKYP